MTSLEWGSSQSIAGTQGEFKPALVLRFQAPEGMDDVEQCDAWPLTASSMVSAALYIKDVAEVASHPQEAHSGPLPCSCGALSARIITLAQQKSRMGRAKSPRAPKTARAARMTTAALVVRPRARPPRPAALRTTIPSRLLRMAHLSLSWTSGALWVFWSMYCACATSNPRSKTPTRHSG